ncbi:MAG: hypothetical protein OXP71_17330 [Candidatus Poribacteria bacterium]|nr:hypothetical protein [Candidatus Poribacteria bacterium]
MKTCKQLKELHTEYICDLLDDERMNLMEEHLQHCPSCVHAVGALKNVLCLTGEAGTISIPEPILNNLEVKVYKRLVIESSQSAPVSFLSRIFGVIRSTGNWRIAAACCILILSVPVASIVYYQSRSVVAPLSSNDIQSPHERVEQYKRQQYQADLDNALETVYLRDDDWASVGAFQKMKEQGKGHLWESFPDERLHPRGLAPNGGI